MAAHCATLDLFDEWIAIDLCEKSDEGNQFYTEMGDKTAPVSGQLVNGLAVQINGVVQTDAVNNLLKAVCDAYEAPTVRKQSDLISKPLNSFIKHKNYDKITIP